MKIHIELDTDFGDDVAALRAIAGVFAPAVEVKVRTGTSELAAQLFNPPGNQEPAKIAATSGYVTVLPDTDKTQPRQEAVVEPSSVTIDDMKAVMGRFIATPTSGGPAALVALLKPYGASCLIGENQLDPKHYAAVKADIEKALA